MRGEEEGGGGMPEGGGLESTRLMIMMMMRPRGWGLGTPGLAPAGVERHHPTETLQMGR